MKKIFILICFPFLLSAQTPNGINYQAVARDSIGALLVNQSIDVKFSIISTSTTGTLEYEETHAATTNNMGLFTLIIGQGTYVSGNSTTIKDVDWGGNVHFLRVDIDPTSSSNYTHMGTSQIMTVPYSYYSEEAGKIRGGSGSSGKALIYLGGL